MADSQRPLQEQQPGSPDADASRGAAASAADADAQPGAEAPAGGIQSNGEPEGGESTAETAGDGAAEEVQGDLDALVKKAAQRDEYLALAQRTQADFENYRKRVARESASSQARGCILLAKELLPALDNLDRALGAAAQDDPLLDGVRIVRSELSAALARTGIESFSPSGEVFDPAVHEAVATSEQPTDGAPSGTVVEVYQPGYRFGETIIRPARVVVAA
jgi:molecular chaperone GrpE